MQMHKEPVQEITCSVMECNSRGEGRGGRGGTSATPEVHLLEECVEVVRPVKQEAKWGH